MAEIDSRLLGTLIERWRAEAAKGVDLYYTSPVFVSTLQKCADELEAALAQLGSNLGALPPAPPQEQELLDHLHELQTDTQFGSRRSLRERADRLAASPHAQAQEHQLVGLVRDGLLETRILMLCPFGAGVSTAEYTHLSQVESYWPCSCGAEHSFEANLATIQFRRPALPPAHGWQPIETVPRDKTHVLVYKPNGQYDTARYSAYSEPRATYWTKFPDPPTAYGWHAEKEK